MVVVGAFVALCFRWVVVLVCIVVFVLWIDACCLVNSVGWHCAFIIC